MEHINAMTGPEFLQAVANQETANGNDVNAHTFRERAAQWKHQLQQLDQALSDLQDARDRLEDIARTARPQAAA